MLVWVWVAVGVVSLIILGAALGSVVGRLSLLQRAAVKLQRRQNEAMRLQEGVAQLEQTALALQERAELMQQRLQTIQAGLGKGDR